MRAAERRCTAILATLLPKVRWSCLGLTVAWLCAPAGSAPTVPTQVSACASCHGATGESLAPDIPNLAGQKRDYLVSQLMAFRAGERKNDMMQAVAGQLTPHDVQLLAEYWAALPPAAPDSAAVGTVPIPSQMRFPARFPAGLTEYDRGIDPATRVVFVRYANALALDAARAGRPLPLGSLLFTGEYAAALDATGKPLKDLHGRWAAASLQSVSGMQAEKGWGEGVPSLLRNADWHYGLWSATGQSRLAGNHARCLACHKPLSAQSHVFTLPALQRPITPPTRSRDAD